MPHQLNFWNKLWLTFDKIDLNMTFFSVTFFIKAISAHTSIPKENKNDYISLKLYEPVIHEFQILNSEFSSISNQSDLVLLVNFILFFSSGEKFRIQNWEFVNICGEQFKNHAYLPTSESSKFRIISRERIVNSFKM